MAVHQCPRCELRFRDEPEVRAHLVDDHKVDPEQLEHHYRPGRTVRPHRDVPDPTADSDRRRRG